MSSLGNLTVITAQEPCGSNIIYVNPKLIVDANMTLAYWIQINPNMVICKTTIDEITVDLGAFKNKDNVPIWLSDNSAYIDFKKSYSLIESIHKLNSADHGAIINQANQKILNLDFIRVTYTELKLHEFKVDIDTIPQARYYKNHLRVIDKNIFHNVLLVNKDHFDKNHSSFSTPFILSIMYNRNISPVNYGDCFFTFTYVDNTTKGVLKFTFDGTSEYYDMSDEPGYSK